MRPKRRRLAYQAELDQVADEYARYGMFTGEAPYDFCDESDPLHMIVDIYYDYVDSLYPDSDYY